MSAVVTVCLFEVRSVVIVCLCLVLFVSSWCFFFCRCCGHFASLSSCFVSLCSWFVSLLLFCLFVDVLHLFHLGGV